MSLLLALSICLFLASPLSLFAVNECPKNAPSLSPKALKPDPHFFETRARNSNGIRQCFRWNFLPPPTGVHVVAFSVGDWQRFCILTIEEEDKHFVQWFKEKVNVFACLVFFIL